MLSTRGRKMTLLEYPAWLVDNIRLLPLSSAIIPIMLDPPFAQKGQS